VLSKLAQQLLQQGPFEHETKTNGRERTATMTSSKRFPFTSKIAGFVALTLTTLGATGIASAKNARGERGIVEARGPVVKVVAAGPIALHTYSQFAGGALYAAPALTGTERDCKGSSASTPVVADQVATFVVGEGQVACLETTTKGSFELLWHAVSQPAPVVVLAKAGN
jgi:hypothetical protein